MQRIENLAENLAIEKREKIKKNKRIRRIKYQSYEVSAEKRRRLKKLEISGILCGETNFIRKGENISMIII